MLSASGTDHFFGNGIVSPVLSSPSNPVTNVIFSDGIGEITASALAFCPDLIAVSVPDTVTTIEDNAFANCPTLTQIRLPARFWKDRARLGLNTNAVVVNASLAEVSTVLFQSFAEGANSMTNQVEQARAAGRVEVTTNPSAFNLFTQAQHDDNRVAGQNDVISNPSGFGLYRASDFEANRTNGRADVINEPAKYGLVTQAEFEGNYVAGQMDVVSNPARHGLYTSNSIMDLRMGGLMVQKQGSNAVVTFQPLTTTDLALPFTNNGTPITHQIPMPGSKGFIRIRANP